MAAGYWSPLAIASADGPTLTAAARATCLPVTAKYTWPPNAFVLPTILKVTATGRISCVVTTPGTARLDLSFGGNIFYDTGALNLNIVAKTTVPWKFEAFLTIRALGATANLFSWGEFQSEAVVGSALPSAGGNGSLNAPVGTPAVGGNIDITAQGAFDMNFTQTVATGSFTVQQLLLESVSLPTP